MAGHVSHLNLVVWPRSPRVDETFPSFTLFL